MVNILEYIVSNYVWFLGSAILILLAIIGYYADKTNFGFGDKIQEKKELDTSKLQNIGLSNIINGDMENSNTSNENNINAQDELINTQVQNIEGEKLEPKAEESSQLNSDLSQASYYTHGEEKLTTSSNFENSLDISESLPNDVLVSKENPNNNIEVENSESKILNQDYETEENSSSEMNSINLNESTRYSASRSSSISTFTSSGIISS